MTKIPMKCRVCYHANREEGFCQWEYDEDEPKLPFVKNCDEFKFEILFLIDVLEELEQ